MHLRFTKGMNVPNWYGLQGGQFVPLAELCQIDTNGDHLLPADAERLLVQTVVEQFGMTYRLKMSYPNVGLRPVESMSYQGFLEYSQTKNYDITCVGAAPAKEVVPAVTQVTEPVIEIVVEEPERVVSAGGTFVLFPEIGRFLDGATKKAS